MTASELYKLDGPTVAMAARVMDETDWQQRSVRDLVPALLAMASGRPVSLETHTLKSAAAQLTILCDLQERAGRALVEAVVDLHPKAKQKKLMRITRAYLDRVPAAGMYPLAGVVEDGAQVACSLKPDCPMASRENHPCQWSACDNPDFAAMYEASRLDRDTPAVADGDDTPDPERYQPAAGTVTVAELDEWIDCLDNAGFAGKGNTLRSLRPLVAEAEAKRRVMDAGCGWQEIDSNQHGGTIWVRRDFRVGNSTSAGHRCWTWAEAAEWAEGEAANAQAVAEQAEWSEVLSMMSNAYVRDLLLEIGVSAIPAPCGEMLVDDSLIDFARGVAHEQKRYDYATDRIWTGELPMPEGGTTAPATQ